MYMCNVAGHTQPIACSYIASWLHVYMRYMVKISKIWGTAAIILDWFCFCLWRGCIVYLE